MKYFIMLALCLGLKPAPAQQQLTHFPTSPASSGPDEFCALGNQLFFTAVESSTGRELYTTDGTTNKTVLVKDINQGSGSASFSNLTSFKGKVFFMADDGVHGQQLWQSDGSKEGTIMVSNNIFNGVYSIVSNSSSIYFIRQTGSNTEVWKSDGTPSGTVMVKGELKFRASIRNLNCTEDYFYFSAVSVDTHPYQRAQAKIWRSDGTPSGTVAVSSPQYASNRVVDNYSEHPAQFLELNHTLYFIAVADFPTQTQVGLLKLSNGTTEPVKIKGLYKEDQLSRIDFFQGVVLNGKMYFVFYMSNENRMMVAESDGTEAGTSVIYDQSFGGFFYPSKISVGENKIFFTSGNSGNGTSLVELNLQTKVSREIKQIYGAIAKPLFYSLEIDYGMTFITSTNKVFVMVLGQNYEMKLWASDGTPETTTQLDAPLFYWGAIFNDRVYFGGSKNGDVELWMADGRSPAANLLKDINTGKTTNQLGYVASIKNSVLTVADDGVHGSEPWVSDGTIPGTHMMIDLNPGSASTNAYNYYPWNDQIIFTLPDNSLSKLMISDGTATGTSVLHSSKGNFNQYQYVQSLDGNTLYFAAPRGDTVVILYKLAKGSTAVQEIISFPNDVGTSTPHFVKTMHTTGNVLYFSVYSTVDTSLDLWRSDGTAVNTFKLGTYWDISSMTSVGNTLYYLGLSSSNQGKNILYSTDGTVAGTHKISTSDGGDVTSSGGLTSIGNKLLFASNTLDKGTELWVTDGTQQGTSILKDIATGQRSGLFSLELVAYNSLIYFTGMDDANGPELWSTDGTSANTKLVKDIAQGNDGSKPRAFEVFDGRLVFSAYTVQYGEELWESDGTTDGTQLFLDIIPGDKGSNPILTKSAGESLVIMAGTRTEGTQLFGFTPEKVTSIEEQQTNFDVYPNPTEGIIKITGEQTATVVDLFSIDGRLLEHLPIDSNQSTTNISHHKPGVYILKVTEGKKVVTSKIVKF